MGTAAAGPGRPLVLDERTLAPLLEMGPLIDLMAETLAATSSGRAQQPVRHVLSPERHGSFVAVMPGYLADTDAIAIKVVSVVPRNAERGLPTHLATLLLLDPMTGALLAVMDGRLVTEMRTAAVSAVSARVLAREDASTLALIGSGVQAGSHLEALAHVRSLKHVRVWSPTREHRERFVRERQRSGSSAIDAVDSAEEAVRGADLVVTATASATPVLKGAWLEPGAHVMAVGAGRADKRELDAEAVGRAIVFVDSAAAARVEAGDLLIAEAEGALPPHHVRGELGAVLAGILPGRRAVGEITLFKSLGMAVEDVAAARYVYEKALECGAGVRIAL